MSKQSVCRAKDPSLCRVHGNFSGFIAPQTSRNFGLTDKDLKEYLEASDNLRSNLSEDEQEALHQYMINDYVAINSYLRGGKKLLVETLISRKFERIVTDETLNRYINRAERNIKEIDSAFAKSDNTQGPRVLYKIFRIKGSEGKETTSSAEIKSYVEKNFKVGSIIENKSYNSTSVDSDYIVMASNKRPSQVIVQEILTRQGIPLADTSLNGIQSHEKEVLLPRNIKLEVVNVVKANYSLSDESKNLGGLSGFYKGNSNKRRFTVVQLREVEQ